MLSRRVLTARQWNASKEQIPEWPVLRTHGAAPDPALLPAWGEEWALESSALSVRDFEVILEEGGWFSSLFYCLYASETLLKSVELHCQKTQNNRASIQLDIFNVDKANNVNRVQSSMQDWSLASLICLSRSHPNPIIFLKFFYLVIFLGVIRIKFTSQVTPQTQSCRWLNIGNGIKNTMLKGILWNGALCIKRPAGFLSEGLAEGLETLTAANFFFSIY